MLLRNVCVFIRQLAYLLFVYYLGIFSVAEFILEWIINCLKNGDFESMWQQAVVAYLNALFWHLKWLRNTTRDLRVAGVPWFQIVPFPKASHKC